MMKYTFFKKNIFRYSCVRIIKIECFKSRKIVFLDTINNNYCVNDQILKLKKHPNFHRSIIIDILKIS